MVYVGSRLWTKQTALQIHKDKAFNPAAKVTSNFSAKVVFQQLCWHHQGTEPNNWLPKFCNKYTHTKIEPVLYLFGLSVRFVVQRAYPSPLQGLVVIDLRFGLVCPVCGAVAGLQIVFFIGRLILRPSPDELHGFHVCVCFVLIPVMKKRR